ncbi:porin [Coralloluteibacterium stylophorae]|uniref:Porin n=1 Tax=Coralloluteibacterium stylophorae TaxID=1776034 RepID=A0A8J7VUN2_9GAMM|nr:porin [Coralloluteibacterium stylophorae]MBS7457103.1 porin [Coralloluteibacterium stylophorae]
MAGSRARACVAVLACAIAPVAGAVEFEAGEWTLDVGGFVNAYYTSVDCSGDVVGGAALASPALGCGGEDSRTTIGNGLLPNALVTKASSRQGGYDIGATIAIMAHTATSSAIAPNSGVDVRQAFFTIGGDFGTIKLGRDYGMFGANAILGDMTLLGVGMPIQATQRGRVTLGHIGAGYAWLGNYGQIAYSTPGESGFGFSAALVSPVDNDGAYVSDDGPQVQAQLSWTSDAFEAWAVGKYQKFKTPDDVLPGDAFTMAGVELGASYTGGPLKVLVNVQQGDGLGILADGDQGDVEALHWFAQTTWALDEQWTLGLNYGVSKNRDAPLGDATLESNRNATLGAYFKLTESVTLAGEVSQTRSEDYGGNEARMNGLAFGGIIFF